MKYLYRTDYDLYKLTCRILREKLHDPSQHVVLPTGISLCLYLDCDK